MCPSYRQCLHVFDDFLSKIRPKVSRSPPSSMSFIQIICVLLTFIAQFIGILYNISWLPILTIVCFPKNYHCSVKSNMYILTQICLNVELISFYTRIRDAVCNFTRISICGSSHIVMMKHHTKCHMIVLRRCTHYNVINFLCCTHFNILLIWWWIHHIVIVFYLCYHCNMRLFWRHPRHIIVMIQNLICLYTSHFLLFRPLMNMKHHCFHFGTNWPLQIQITEGFYCHIIRIAS